MFRKEERRPLLWCPRRTWSVRHNHPSKNFSRTSTENGKKLLVHPKINLWYSAISLFRNTSLFGQVKWIRVLYSDFAIFVRDQEHLISAQDTYDNIEGFVIINRTGLLNNWRSSFNPRDPVQASQFESDGRTLYCLELAKNFNPDKIDIINKVRHVMINQSSNSGKQSF